MRNGTTTKERIERTALGLFARKGIRETTIRHIASAAGIAEGTMYRHYRSKDDLARDLFVTNFVALGRELRRAQAEEATTEGKIRAMIRYFCTVYEQNPDMFTYLFLARHDHMQAIQSRMANPYFVFRRVIRDGMNRGEVPKQDPDVAASMVMGVVLQVIDSRLLGDRIRKSISTLADTIAAACWRVLQVS